MRSFILAAFFALCAGQVFALGINITLGSALTTISATEFLAPVDASLAACSDSCKPATAAVTACGTDDACLCSNATVAAIVVCEDCMFKQLIHDNRRPNDPRAGQTSAIAAYGAACTLSNHTIQLSAKDLAVAVPPDWNGPFGQGLTTLGTVVSVAAAAIIGTGMITVVSTM